MPIIFLLIFSAILAQNAHAGAAVAKQQQMKAMQSQAYQQAVAQAMAERQQAEAQAYAQAQAQYQMAQYQVAQYKAAQEYMMAQHMQQAIVQQIAERVRAQQMDQIQMQMVQQVVQQQLIQQVAAQIQANQIAEVKEAMISQAIQEAVVKLGMQAYINEEVQQRMAAQTIMATKQVAATSQMAQFQSAKDFVKNPQMQSGIASKVDQFYTHAQTSISKEVFQQTVENVLIRKIAQMMAQGSSVEPSPEMIDLAISEAANLLGIQSVLKTSASPGYEPALGNDVSDIVDVEDLWKSFDHNSHAWNLIIDDQIKAMTVNEFIERYRKRKIRISKSPQVYVKMIDDMASQNPQLLDNPFMGIMQIIAVMEYDFDYGGDRDALARKLLGPMYESNKQRLSASH